MGMRSTIGSKRSERFSARFHQPLTGIIHQNVYCNRRDAVALRVKRRSSEEKSLWRMVRNGEWAFFQGTRSQTISRRTVMNHAGERDRRAQRFEAPLVPHI